MRARAKKRQQGVVLIAVVWSVFILTAMAFGLATLVRTGSEELRARKEQLQAYYLARGAVYRVLTVFKQATAQGTDAPLLLANPPRIEWDEADTRVRVEIVDEGGKLDLNSAPPALLEKLFLNFGLDLMAAHDLVAAIGDWRDPDDDTRLGGAESLYYLTLPQPYRPANRDFRSAEELLLVRGVTPDLFYGGFGVTKDGAVERRLGLVDCLTVHTRSTQVNINYAPLPVLLAIPGVDPLLAQYILQARQGKLLASVQEFTRNYPILIGGETLSYLSTASSGVYAMIATGTTASGITARVRAVVQVSGLDTPAVNQKASDGRVLVTPARLGPPFLILSWDDSYVR